MGILDYLSKISRNITNKGGDDRNRQIVFFDTEVDTTFTKVVDIGAFKEPDIKFHSSEKKSFVKFVGDSYFLCGHNIIHHDIELLDIDDFRHKGFIDTLYLSPLFFPQKPYHKLLKDDKLLVDERNNPLNDSAKARNLFYDELNAFNDLSEDLKNIYSALLNDIREFAGFFEYVGAEYLKDDVTHLIRKAFEGKICEHVDLTTLVRVYPVELAYALALVSVNDRMSITPPWIVRNYPAIDTVMNRLCGTPCHKDCAYCNEKLDVHRNLKLIFGYDDFRKFNGMPLQEDAVQAAVDGRSLLAVFPTGGGKSLTFQLPAIMEGRNCHGLTVVISPLLSLMKDQVDNLIARGITEAVTINGLLDPLSRADAIESVRNGSASLLYIAPEMLRSKTIENILLERNVVRFVIDEAHCFSSWGHDFRVDYLFVGDFIKNLQENKNLSKPIPVSCFTATAKKKVISDICDYFKIKTGVDLMSFATNEARKNLHYSVVKFDKPEAKYVFLRNKLVSNTSPAIIYVSRTKRAEELAEKLTSDGIPTLAFHGKMEANEKTERQNMFISNLVRVMVATSAFGMGVDKKDVGMVIHYDISDSLENYIQESGRAGRDQQINAQCYVLYCEDDLNKHFILLNQTKLNIGEIQQVWSAVKGLTKYNGKATCSTLELARLAGWNDNLTDTDTRVHTAISALEEAGYLKRGCNVPHVFATGLLVRNMDEARRKMWQSKLFNEQQEQEAVMIIKKLISAKYKDNPVRNNTTCSRVDYIAELLGMTTEKVIEIVNMLRESGIIADSRDMIVYLSKNDSFNKSTRIFRKFAKLERFLLEYSVDEKSMAGVSLKELNETASTKDNNDSNIKNIKIILYFLSTRHYIVKKENVGTGYVSYSLCQEVHQSLSRYERRIDICRIALEWFYKNAESSANSEVSDGIALPFSLIDLFNHVKNVQGGLFATKPYELDEVEEALLFLSRIECLRLEGGFLVLYNGMMIHRTQNNLKQRYKKEDYKLLQEHYDQKIKQIHIVGEYAELMSNDYAKATNYVQDYFALDADVFMKRYFKPERIAEMNKNITPKRYRQLVESLSPIQRKIIDDKTSKYIVVAAGPGSGKTRILVHKLASLLTMEDVKHEQLLMLTFSRAAATEFKKRLMELVGSAAYFVEIKTFHSYCFDLLGKTGSLNEVDEVMPRATRLIENAEVEQSKISKTVLVIDEAQDMDADAFKLVTTLMHVNEDMRVIAVGDDDQNIYEFRGSKSYYLQSLVSEYGAVQYEMTQNYRSCPEIIGLANLFVSKLKQRMKTKPCSAVTSAKGNVCITQYKNDCIYSPIIAQLINNGVTGQICIMTETNDEAVQMMGMLVGKGIRTRLIQSTEGFRFADLAEVRYFMKEINNNVKTPIIGDLLWEQAKNKTINRYGKSSLVECMLAFFNAFEQVHPNEKYLSELLEFVDESKIEDFSIVNSQSVVVSTIHKTKGREFDTVYMMLVNEKASNDEYLRKIYVGMTRAKKNLYIHTNNNLFSTMNSDSILYHYDENDYPQPVEITLQLTHKDVYLDFFRDKKNVTLQLQSGSRLFYNNYRLYSEKGDEVVSLSSKMQSQLLSFFEQDFKVSTAEVGYVVAWKPKNKTEEVAIILPLLKLIK